MNDLSRGSVKKQLLVFCLPFLAGMVLQSLINFTDLMFVSHFSEHQGSAAGVGVGNQLCYLVINAVVGLSVGGSIIISQSFGAKKYDEMQKASSTLLILLLVLSVIIGISVILGAKGIIRLLKTPENAAEEAYKYVFVTMTGLPFVFIYNGISAVLRAMGDTKNPLLFILLACILNAGLDAVAVILFKGGAGGVALSTVIAQGIACIISFVYLRKKIKKSDITKAKAGFSGAKLKEIIKTGVPVAVQNIAASLSFLVLTYVINVACKENGVAALTASSMVFKLNAFAILPSRSFSMAVASMVGQNKGAEKLDRVKETFKYSVIFGVIIGLGFSLLSFFGARMLLNMFKTTSEILSYGIPYMKFLSLDYIFLPFAVSMFGLVDGLGKTKVSMWVSLITSAVLRLPLAYLAGVIFKWGISGIGIAVPLSTLISAVIMAVYIRKKIWKRLEKTPADK